MVTLGHKLCPDFKCSKISQPFKYWTNFSNIQMVAEYQNHLVSSIQMVLMVTIIWIPNKIVRYSNGCYHKDHLNTRQKCLLFRWLLNTGLFEIKICFRPLNTRLVWYSKNTRLVWYSNVHCFCNHRYLWKSTVFP